MTQLEWDKTGEKEYETGVSHGVLYTQDNTGAYSEGHAWNGLVSVTDSPSGAESNKQYADNIVYANIKSAEEVGGTIEAFTAPKAFGDCDGTREIVPGLLIGQQNRKSFGFSWQSLVGNDLEGTDFGYKIHIRYGADANPSEKQYQTINDSPEPATLSWEYTTTAVPVPGFKPTSSLTFKSTDFDPVFLEALKEILYGTEGTVARLPMPAEIIALVQGAVPVEIRPAKPTQVGNVITIPNVAGAQYSIDNTDVESGPQPAITEDVFVKVRAKAGYKLPSAGYDADWLFEFDD